MLDRISFHSHLSPPYWTHYHSQFNFENMNIFWMRIKVKALAQGLWLDWIDVRVTPHVLHNHVYRMGILLHYQKERERECSWIEINDFIFRGFNFEMAACDSSFKAMKKFLFLFYRCAWACVLFVLYSNQ